MSDNSFLPVRVLLFAVLRDAMQCDQIEVAIPIASAGSTPTVADLLAACALQFPRLADWLPHIRVAVNCEYSASETLLAAADEIAFIPPVAGG
jgi:molybdopterin synthase catalytic subunit